MEDGTHNFDSQAQILEGCIFVRAGCMDSMATNFNSDANTPDASCAYEVFGCNADAALNYDSLATAMQVGSCVYPLMGCMDTRARNFAIDANIPCIACCTYTIPGCMSFASVNFDSFANLDDGSCTVLSPPPSPPPPRTPPLRPAPSPPPPMPPPPSPPPPTAPLPSSPPSPPLRPSPTLPPSPLPPQAPSLSLSPSPSNVDDGGQKFLTISRMTVSGAVDDFTLEVRDVIIAKFAEIAGVATTHVYLEVVAASVHLTVTIQSSSQTVADAIQLNLAASLGSASAATAVMPDGFVVESKPTFTVTAVPASGLELPSPPPPFQSPSATFGDTLTESLKNFMNCTEQSSFLPVVVVLVVAALVGQLLAAARDRTQCKQTQGGSHTSKRAQIWRSCLNYHTLLSSAHRGWMGLTHAQSALVLLNCATTEVALVRVLLVHWTSKVVLAGAVASLCTTLATPLFLFFFDLAAPCLPRARVIESAEERAPELQSLGDSDLGEQSASRLETVKAECSSVRRKMRERWSRVAAPAPTASREVRVTIESTEFASTSTGVASSLPATPPPSPSAPPWDAVRGAYSSRNHYSIELCQWITSWLWFAGLLVILLLPDCGLGGAAKEPTQVRELLLSWLWSASQRFLLSEPLLVLLAHRLLRTAHYDESFGTRRARLGARMSSRDAPTGAAKDKKDGNDMDADVSGRHDASLPAVSNERWAEGVGTVERL